MVAANFDGTRVPVLIIGGGPVGLALALDLGWRGVRCLVVEQNDGTIAHPRANAVNVRTMEFCRRWGVADRVREVGMPPDYPHTAIYLTSLAGHEIARIERPAHGGGGTVPVSPERPQRCNQLWFDPVLERRATGFPGVEVRHRCRFESFSQDEDGVDAIVTDLATGKKEPVRADWLVACCGGRSGIRDTLGIPMAGKHVLSHATDIFFRAPALWDRHDKGKGALHFLVGDGGVWGSLNAVDGREYWRLVIHRTEGRIDPATLDVEGMLRRATGFDFPHEVLAVTPWIRRELVAESYGKDRVFIAGDCAHVNSPSGGHGMNTGLGDAADLGWKLAALVQGWGGGALPASYGIERRPVAVRNVGESTRNHEFRSFTAPGVAEDTPEGARIRAELGRSFVEDGKRRFGSFGIALGYCYRDSPLICAEGEDYPPDDPSRYVPCAMPGCRAPHRWLSEERSIIDLFGRGFVLLRLGGDRTDISAFSAAAAERHVPLEIRDVDDPDVAALYERRLVLVRPDGHIAWRGDAVPRHAPGVIDRVRGAEKAG